MEGAIAPAIAPATFECNNAPSYLPLSELNTRYDRSSKQLVTNESHWTGWAGEQLVTIVHKYQHYLNDVRHGQVASDRQSRGAKCKIHNTLPTQLYYTLWHYTGYCNCNRTTSGLDWITLCESVHFVWSCMELDNKVGRDGVQCSLTSDAPICESPCCICRLGYICCGEVFYLEIMQHFFQRMDIPILGVWKSHRTNRMPLSCTLAIITVSHIEKSEAMSSWMKTQSKCCVVCETNTLSAFASWVNFSTSRSLWWMPLWNFCAVLGFQCNATVNSIIRALRSFKLSSSSSSPSPSPSLKPSSPSPQWAELWNAWGVENCWRAHLAPSASGYISQ